MVVSGGYSISAHDAHHLTKSELMQARDIIIDGLGSSRGMGEYLRVRQDTVSQILSKEDVFAPYFSRDVINRHTASSLRRMLEASGENILKLYPGAAYIEPPDFDEYISQSLASSLVLCHDMSGQLVGSMFVYVTDFDMAFGWEFEAHYPRMREKIRERISRIFPVFPSHFFVFSAISMLISEATIQTFFRMLKEWARFEKSRKYAFPAIAEMDTNNNFYRMCKNMEMLSLKVGQYAQCTVPMYASELFVSVDPVESVQAHQLRI